MEKLAQSIFCFDNEISCGLMLLRLFFSSQKLKANLICLNYPIVDLFIGSQMNS